MYINAREWEHLIILKVNKCGPSQFSLRKTTKVCESCAFP